jgi:HSP20 family protein
MAITRWRPLHEMDDLQREMNRLFDNILTPISRDEGVALAFSPAAEINETPDGYHLKLEVPGMEPDDIHIEVTDKAVSISGERQTETLEETEGKTRSEFRYGKFQRVIPIQCRINNQNVSAEYNNGILHLTLPKAEEEKRKVVKVSVQ